MNDIRLSIKKGKICDLNKCLYIYIHFLFKCDLRCTLFYLFQASMQTSGFSGHPRRKNDQNHDNRTM